MIIYCSVFVIFITFIVSTDRGDKICGELFSNPPCQSFAKRKLCFSKHEFMGKQKKFIRFGVVSKSNAAFAVESDLHAN